MGEQAKRRSGSRHPWRSTRARIGWAGIANLGVAAVLLVVGVGFAVVFAATMAVVMAFATVLLALAALAWRIRRPVPRPVAVARGHAWIDYDWERRRR